MVDSSRPEGIPEPLDGDDDDVAWALQTAAVEWRRSVYADALTWLRRAASAASDAGHEPRSAYLEATADRLEQRVARQPAPGAPSAFPVVVDVDEADDADDGLDSIEEVESIEEIETIEEVDAVEAIASIAGLGAFPSMRSEPPRTPPPPPGARLPALPNPPPGPAPTDAPPPSDSGRPTSVAGTRRTAITSAPPGRSLRPLSRGGVLHSIAHPPDEERYERQSSLPVPRSRRDSGLGQPPSSDAASYFPGVLGGRGGAPPPLERPPGSRPAAPPSARRAPEPTAGDDRSGASRRRAERSDPRAARVHGAEAERPSASRAGADGRSSAPKSRGARRRGAPEDTRSAGRDGARPAPVDSVLPELPRHHPEADQHSAAPPAADLELPLVQESAAAAAGEGAAEDEALPVPSAPEPEGPPSSDAPDSRGDWHGSEPGGPDLPDLDAMDFSGATDSLIPDAPALDEDFVPRFPPDPGLGIDGPGGALTDDPSALADRSSDAEPIEPSVLGVRLSSVRGLQDLSVESQQVLARRAKLEVLQPEEEISAFAVALVVKGDVGIVPAVSDIPCGYAQKGDVVFTRGSLEGGIALSVVAGPDGAAVATWDEAALDAALGDSPWVGDELAEVADRFQAMAGATMGPLGQRLDESLMASVFAKAEVRLLFAGDLLLEAGRPVQGISVVGAGRIEVVGADGRTQELHPGDLVFPAATPSSAPAPASARAGTSGALVLQVGRHETHELLVSVPPLLEVLATS